MFSNDTQHQKWLGVNDFSSSWLHYFLMFLPVMYLPHRLPIWLNRASQRTIIIINAVCIMGLLHLLIIGFTKIIK